MMDAPQAIPQVVGSSAVRLVATLTFAGFMSGLIIVGAYEATLPAITTYKAQTLREAVSRVLPGVAQVQRLVFRDGLLTASEEQRAAEEAIFGGFDAGGQLVGYAIPGAGPGFADTIKILYGYLPGPRRVVGMEVLTSKETPGIGDKIYKDADFVANFKDLAVDPEVVAVKKGRRTSPNQIDAISGATISSKAVVKIINQANRQWLPHTEGGALVLPAQ